MIEGIKCAAEVFNRDPLKVIKAYEAHDTMFSVLMQSVKDGDPELALVSIDFWDRFITAEGVVYKEDFKKKIFD